MAAAAAAVFFFFNTSPTSYDRRRSRFTKPHCTSPPRAHPYTKDVQERSSAPEGRALAGVLRQAHPQDSPQPCPPRLPDALLQLRRLGHEGQRAPSPFRILTRSGADWGLERWSKLRVRIASCLVKSRLLNCLVSRYGELMSI
ncbi:uncharacterized protein LOC120290257 isoform X1 [Eucalyptus grandis]|uniref:uncharacterized protein LOC120290257 isoform X1 n=1 Tax=Eucalyptus grandis TaxID=71139 RepID=UPI00192EF14D|nr:uncharacterized protein LOC120290257 isoform X1 [Eucalyptus grandis]